MRSSSGNERQDICIDDVCMCRVHAVRIAGIDFQRAVPKQPVLKDRRVLVRHNLIIIALQHKYWHCNGFQILGLICFGECELPRVLWRQKDP